MGIRKLMWTKYPSQEDASVNFVCDTSDGGKLETRFVQRVPEYFIIYLSSHTGCNKSCRMCHLTATGQTMFTPVTRAQYRNQANIVFNHYDTLQLEEKPTKVHFNWMARGEPLANPHLLNNASKIFNNLGRMASHRGLESAFKISTIMPYEVQDKWLAGRFLDLPVDLYYSLYSVEERFRKRFLPKAMPADIALNILRDVQQVCGRQINFHWPFIEGENDSVELVEKTLEAITSRKILGKFNLVRYNPPNDKTKESPPEVLERNFKIISEALGDPGSRIVPRVGFDVKASCGMFVGDNFGH